MMKQVLTAMTIAFGYLAISASAQSPTLADVKATCSRAEPGRARDHISAILAALEEQKWDYARQLAYPVLDMNLTEAQRTCARAALNAAQRMEMETRDARFKQERDQKDGNECPNIERTRYGRCLTPAEKAAAEANRAEEERLASQPDRQLKTVYKHYIAMQSCYEARKEFERQYVSRQELDAARAITRREESHLLSKFPQLVQQKDSLWDDAKREYGDSDFAVLLRVSGTSHNRAAEQNCKLVSTRYTADKDYQQQQIKKDF